MHPTITITAPTYSQVFHLVHAAWRRRHTSARAVEVLRRYRRLVYSVLWDAEAGGARWILGLWRRDDPDSPRHYWDARIATGLEAPLCEETKP